VFTVSGAARQLGIPAATLRTWERRHGIGPSGRSTGGHRRYTSDDLIRLRAMRTLVATGVPPAQAAGLAALAAGDPAAPAPADPMMSPALLIQAAVRLDAPLLSLLTTLLAVITLAPPARTIRPVVLACAEEEQHVLPVYALHAELAGRGVDVRQLGGRVPRRALAHAVSTVHPAAVFIWSQVPATAQRGLLGSLPAGQRIVLGGPGWQHQPPRDGIRLAESLEEAAAEMAGCAFAPTG
jgi:DNA-binding transcriptional MerR regulator